MSEVEHLVKVYPIRLESPSVSRGKRYQMVFVRGKTKAKAPRPIACTESCFVDFTSLGCFSQAVVHFKGGHKKSYQPKMISFEFLDCTAGDASHGTRLGEADIDVAALLTPSGPGTFNDTVKHAFRLGGYGATFIVGITIQPIHNGKAVGGDLPLNTSALAALGVGASAGGGATNSAAPAAQPVEVDNFYLPRDSAIAVLSRVEEYTKVAALNARQVTEATAGVGGQSSLSNLLALSHDVMAINLKHIPDRTLMSRASIEREANRYDVSLAEKDPQASEAFLRHLLAQSRERLVALRRAEELVEQEEQQIVTMLGNGTPTSMEVEREAPLPLLLFCRQFAEAQGNAPPAPSSPHMTQPPVSVAMLQQNAARVAEAARAATAAAAANAAAAATAVAAALPPPPPPPIAFPGTQAMANLFGGGDSASAPQTPAQPQQQQQQQQEIPKQQHRSDLSPTDLVPNLFGDSPSKGGANGNGSAQHKHHADPVGSAMGRAAAAEEEQAAGGLGTNMFASAIAPSRAANEGGNRSGGGLGAGMFTMGGQQTGSAPGSADASPSIGASMFGGGPSSKEPAAGPAPSFGGAGMFGAASTTEVGSSMFGGGGDRSSSGPSATITTSGGGNMFGDPPATSGGYNFGVTTEVSFGGGGEGGGGSSMFGGGGRRSPDLPTQSYFGDGGSFGAPPAHITGGGGGSMFAPTPERGGGGGGFGGGEEVSGGSNPFGGF